MKKLLGTILSVIVLVSIIVGGVYYIYFYPQTEVKSLDSDISINQLEILKRFIPNNTSFSLNKISVDSDVKFSEDEITDFAILAVRNIEDIKDNITGILINIEKDEIKLVVDAKYKSIPVELNLVFNCRSEDGNAVLHYKKGSVGFFSVSKDKILKNIGENKWLKVDESRGDIIVTLDSIDGLEITNVTTDKDNIELSIHGDISIFK